MTTDTTLRCALDIGDRTLSDYRSNGRPAQMERLAAHVATCLACRRRLADYEALARTLRAQPELDGHAQLWQNVRASIAVATAPTAARPGRHRIGADLGSHRSRQLWTALGSVAAIIALSVGFVALFASFGSRTPMSHPAPRIIHSDNLTWRQVTVPKGFPGVTQPSESATMSGPMIARLDGNILYACRVDRRVLSSPVVWATHDAGTHWTIITPGNIPENTGGCRIVIDDNDARMLIVSFFPIVNPQQPALPNTWTTYATFDGGATWTKPAGLQHDNVLFRLASAPGKIYAIWGSSAADGNVNTGLYVSGDQMQNWTRMDGSLSEIQPKSSQSHDTGKVAAMWVNTVTSEVLIQTYAQTVWTTTDDGAHWAKISYPAPFFVGDPYGPSLLIGPQSSGTNLKICGSFTPMESPNQQRLECSADNGKTWVDRGVLNGENPRIPTVNLAGEGTDGSVYATGIASNGNGFAIYRLAPDAMSTRDWQRLGTFPDAQNGVAYAIAPSGAGMIFWTFPSITGGDGGTLTQPNYYVATF